VGFLIFGVGVLVGLVLGVALFSLLGMAQEAEGVHDLLGLGETMAIPEDTYYLSPSDTGLPTSRDKGRSPGDLRGLWPKAWRMNNAGILQIRSLRGGTLKKPSGANSPGPLTFRANKRRQRNLPT
jgi:hypothetical protein